MLEIKNLNKHFNGVQAVKDFSLSIEPGKITSIIGPNGAGKSTVFNIVTGFLFQDSGEVRFNNKPLNGFPAWKINQKGISRTFQQMHLLKSMTVYENVLLGIKKQSGENIFNALFKYSLKKEKSGSQSLRAKDYIEFVGLKDHLYERTSDLSYGQQKLVSIAAALATKPKLLLLDEPVSGVQPEMISLIEKKLHELIKDDITIVLIEHDMDFVKRVSDRVVVMDEGVFIVDGAPSKVLNDPKVLDAYLT